MRKIHQYAVHPAMPERLACLRELAYNLRWTWDHEASELFVRLDADLWEDTNHNPVRLLQAIDQTRLDEAAEDEAFLAHLDRVCQSLQSYMTKPGWFPRRYPGMNDLTIAYFSMEFGLARCLPMYSGGLGVLAGDHLKSASDLDIPLVGVGLLYQKGYFTQYLNADGWQLERYSVNDFSVLPIRRALDGRGEPLRVSVDLAGHAVIVQVWVAQVGRIPLYLLDTNLAENQPYDRDVTDELYGGGPEDRIRQEIVLGIGGIRALKALGIPPQVCHMNEGHSAFLSLERIRDLGVEAGLDYWSARQVTGAGTVFTTHTPVPAGFDLFGPELMEKYFAAYAEAFDLGWQEFLNKGRSNPEDPLEPFNVAVLALRHAPRRNAVSALHRKVTAGMMRPGWPDFPDADIPVGYVTNGIHTRGWVAPEMAVLFDRYLGPRWQEDPSDPAIWERVRQIPDEELWRVHVRQRERLVAYVRARLEAQLTRRRASPRERDAAREALRADALTIGFARRFATYKRATLLLKEVDRLKALLLDERRPVQVIFGGKAHPRDDAGKEFIRHIVHFALQEGVQHRLVFLEDYDLGRAQALVQGADVWLNTPRRPLEASGTSGMKALVNGALNLSVLDGWWAEGHEEGVGWAIGTGEEYQDFEYQDRVEAQALYSILEQEVVPLFYEQSADGLPRGWIAMMKASLTRLAPRFSTIRMVKDYTRGFYLPAAEQHARLSAHGYARARELAEWKARVRRGWSDVKVERVDGGGFEEVTLGCELPLKAKVRLGSLTPADVRVEAYHGPLSPEGDIGDGQSARLEWVTSEDGVHLYQGTVPCGVSGLHGYAVRVLPDQEDVLVPNELPLIVWE